ncbi:MAG: KH domain-containing protein [Leptolyngbyaceae bacterium]|nr:KH domain-containing protein [Leptolyngbyaceae bacterium]
MSDLPNPHDVEVVSSASQQLDVGAAVDYVELVRFLVGPFLDSPSSLRVSCEIASQNQRVLIRLAIEGEDKGKIFGRGGRNIQAVRTVLQSVAQSAQQKVHLEVFGGETERREGGHSTIEKSEPQRSSPQKPLRRSNPSSS